MYKHKISTRFIEPGQLSERTKKRHHAMRQIVIAQEKKWKQEPAEPMKLPRWGAVVAVLPLLCVAAWAVSEVAVPDIVDVLRSGPALLIGIVAVLAVSLSALEGLPLQGTRRVEVLFQRTAAWTVGETQVQCWNRMKSVDVAASVDCYPDEYPGKVISVLDIAEVVAGRETTLTNMADKDRICLTLDLTDAEIAGLRAKTLKMEAGKPVAITLEDHHGAILPELIAKYGSLLDVEAKEQEAEIEEEEAKLTPEIPHETHTFTLDVLRLRRALPKNVTHTGTGWYYVKKVPTVHVDGIANVGGQVITLLGGGLGNTDTYLGGFVSNSTRGQIRSIIQHDDGNVELEGDISTWAPFDGVSVFDSWSTWAAALAQLFTDQSTAEFTLNQNVRGFAGTYAETITPSASLNPSEANGYILIVEGDPGDLRANIIIDTSTCFNPSMDTWIFRHITCDSTGRPIWPGGGSGWGSVQDCNIVTTSTIAPAVVGTSDYLEVKDCSVSSGEDCFNMSDPQMVIDRCSITHTGVGTGDYGILLTASSQRVTVRGCTFANYTGAGSAAVQMNGVRASLVLLNNTLYNCEVGIRNVECPNVVAINNIFDTVTYPYQVPYWPDNVIEGHQGGSFLLRNNMYKAGYTGFAYNGVGTKTGAEFAAFDLVDAAGERVDVDPLLAGPGGGDFSLSAGSPAIHAGFGSGVPYDVNGDPLDPHHPPIGAVGTGIGPNVVYGS